jgi:methylenetetrahydrofolate reductase (NADPH)
MVIAGELFKSSVQQPPLAELTAGFSLEVSTRKSAALDYVREVLPRGADTYVPWIPGDSPERLIHAVVKLRALGFNPVPHIPVRQIKSEAELSEYLGVASYAGGVRQILLIAGDSGRPAGPFTAAGDVLETGLLTKNGITQVGFAGHPEGHPRVDAKTLSEALKSKVELARASGLTPHVVSQFCFKAEPILAWLRGLRQEGINVPARIGLAGPANVATLMRFALHCGIGNSLRTLGQRGAATACLFTEPNPEQVVRAVAAAQAAEPELMVAGFHFFPFGGLERLRSWLHRSDKVGVANAES